MLTVRVSERYGRALDATADLLTRLRIDFAFVGAVARSAWLGSTVERGSLDVLALMQSPQKNQVAMMASNRGFLVNREEIEQSEELDLVPMSIEEIKIHVLVASNALYGRMVAAAVPSDKGKVVTAEDLALLMSVGDDPDAQKLIHLPEFDRHTYNQKLISIGLKDLAVHE